MLVIISDLHFTDGTSGASISPRALDIFAQRLRDLAYAASWRTDGTYRPVERVDLVLLGDVLDLIRSRRWTWDSELRPWDDPQRSEYIELVTRITSDVLRHNDAALRALRGIVSEGGMLLPPALAQGRPAHDSSPLPVDVRIHYLVGNHDWFFHLPGAGYNLLRDAVVRHLALANRADEPFPHDAMENPELWEVLRRHRVLARHGDIYDPFNFEGDRDASSLGDAIVVELLNRFAATVEAELGIDLPEGVLLGLRELDNVRPLLLVPAWIEGLLARACAFPAQRRKVKQVWDGLAERFLDLRFVRQRDSWHPADLVDGLERALRLSRRFSLAGVRSVLSWLQKLRVPGEGSFYQHALSEQEFRNRRAKFIVYGHTHTAETVPLDASFADGYVLNQMYFNSGTWRRVHRQTRLAPDEHEFIATDVMTYLAFFQGDERGGHPFESWTGNLGLAPAGMRVHRVDLPRTVDEAGQPISSSVLHRHAPHFVPSPDDGAVVPTRRVGRVRS